MVEDVPGDREENDEIDPANCLEFDGMRYHVVGEEVMGQGKEYNEKVLNFQKSFVLFQDRRKNSKSVPAYFLIPPVPFPELEEKRDYFSIEHIMSISPSTPADDCIRSLYNLSMKPEYASILVGFDTRAGKSS
jgi:hypothetical protein